MSGCPSLNELARGIVEERQNREDWNRMDVVIPCPNMPLKYPTDVQNMLNDIQRLSKTTKKYLQAARTKKQEALSAHMRPLCASRGLFAPIDKYKIVK